jgi:hypothetical protein
MRSLFAFALLVLAAESALAADNPWVGIWKPDPVRSSYVEVSEPLIISCPSEGVMRWEYRAMGFRMEGKPNGGAMSLTLPNLPKGLTETVTMLTPTKLSYAVYIEGKRVQWGTDELSADGKTLTATSWREGAESEKMVEIFVRQ